MKLLFLSTCLPITVHVCMGVFIYHPDFGRQAHFAMWLKDPVVVTEQSFQGVAQQHNQGEPHSCGKHDSTQYRLSLSRETITAERPTPLKTSALVNEMYLCVFKCEMHLKSKHV